jgi:hypothetical protein
VSSGQAPIRPSSRRATDPPRPSPQRSFLLAWLCVYALYDGNSYPAFGRAATLSLSWMWPIVLRNVAATWIICGAWDW